MFLSETDIDMVENQIEKIEPKFVIIDSIQTMYSDEITSSSGSVSQVREITSRIMKMCKQKAITKIVKLTIIFVTAIPFTPILTETGNVLIRKVSSKTERTVCTPKIIYI